MPEMPVNALILLKTGNPLHGSLFQLRSTPQSPLIGVSYLPLVQAWGDYPVSQPGIGLRLYGRLFADPTIDPEIVLATGKIILGNSP